MERSTERIEWEIDRERAVLRSNLAELENRVKSAVDWRRYFESNPPLWIGVAFGSGLLLAPSPLAMTNTVPLLLVGLQVVKSGMPPPVFLFQVPAHNLPVVGSTSAMVMSGVPLARKVP